MRSFTQPALYAPKQYSSLAAALQVKQFLSQHLASGLHAIWILSHVLCGIIRVSNRFQLFWAYTPSIPIPHFLCIVASKGDKIFPLKPLGNKYHGPQLSQPICRTNADSKQEEQSCGKPQSTGRLDPLPGPPSEFLMDSHVCIHTATCSDACTASSISVKLRGAPKGTRLRGQPGVRSGASFAHIPTSQITGMILVHS
jgi:hypothetical protein